MTASTAQRLPICSRWEPFPRMCPIFRTFWTRFCDVSIAWTRFRPVSISTPLLNACRLADALREQMAQAVWLDQVVWANLEEIGYGG
jgi:hypothetical protein